jgi:DNA-binding HxlR family transcriptional regulator
VTDSDGKTQGASSNRPIMVLLDLLGRKQTLRILWELRDSELTFRKLQEACGDISPSVLNQRLSELRESNIVEHEKSIGYKLSAQGKSLIRCFAPLNAWAKNWRV